MRKDRVESFEKLKNLLVSSVADSAPLFLPAINVLFLLGLVVYHPKNDTFEYVGS
ncbi:ABC-three component system middle component 8 [Chitinibacter mangrovi]|uniref:ABC-three component system middle component 8 n=1 Tax=Chitinibacter mangrovi TaxID=3153927 RepID=UPI003D813A80